MHWIIEEVHPENQDKELADAARAAGDSVLWLTPLRDRPLELLPAPALFHGSIEKAMEIQGQRPDIQLFFEPNKFKCSSYYPAIQPHLLNRDYQMLTVQELQETKWAVYHRFARDTKIFIRPDSGVKTFTGTLLDLQDFDRFWNNKAMCQAGSQDLVIVSTPKVLLGEWRFICSPTQVVAVSCYKYQGNTTYVPSAPKEVTHFCETTLKAPLDLGELFILDIAQTVDGQIGLLEANAFSTGALYAANKQKIINAVHHVSSIMKHGIPS